MQSHEDILDYLVKRRNLYKIPKESSDLQIKKKCIQIFTIQKKGLK